MSEEKEKNAELENDIEENDSDFKMLKDLNEKIKNTDYFKKRK